MSSFFDIFRWDRFVATNAIEVLFWLLAGISVLAGGFGVLAGVRALAGDEIGGLVLITIAIFGGVAGIVLARILCEAVVILFRINDSLAEIADNVAEPADEEAEPPPRTDRRAGAEPARAAARPERREPLAVELAAIDHRVAAAEALDDRRPEPRNWDVRAPEPRRTEPRSWDVRAPEPRPAETSLRQPPERAPDPRADEMAAQRAEEYRQAELRRIEARAAAARQAEPSRNDRSEPLRPETYRPETHRNDAHRQEVHRHDPHPEPRGHERRPGELRHSEPRAAETRHVEPLRAEARPPEPRQVENGELRARSFETKATEPRAGEGRDAAPALRPAIDAAPDDRRSLLRMSSTRDTSRAVAAEPERRTPQVAPRDLPGVRPFGSDDSGGTRSPQPAARPEPLLSREIRTAEPADRAAEPLDAMVSVLVEATQSVVAAAGVVAPPPQDDRGEPDAAPDETDADPKTAEAAAKDRRDGDSKPVRKGVGRSSGRGRSTRSKAGPGRPKLGGG